MRETKAVLFDFDYTLADSSPGILRCMRHALGSLGHEPPDDDTIRAQIGLPLWGTLERLYGAATREADAEFVRLFVEHADLVMADHTTLLAGVDEALAALHAQGLGLGVVSTKFRYRIEQILVREDLRPRFACLIGGEDVTRHKPDPEALERALEALRLERDCVLYVGDSLVDAEAAERARLRFVGVLSGVTPRDAFAAHPSEAVLGSVRELPAWLGISA
jgi:phosphoglycolate phosphatase